MSHCATQRLFWIREPQPGLWEIDVAREFPRSHFFAAVLGLDTDAPPDEAFAAPAALPDAVRQRLEACLGSDPAQQRRLLDALAAWRPAETEIHGPYLSHWQWRKWRETAVLPPLDLKDEPEHFARLAFAGTLPGARGSGEVRWGDTRITRERIARFRRLTTAPGEVLPRYAPISVALQDALREWIATEYLADIARLADFPNTLAVLAYRVSRHASGKCWDRVTHDVIAQWDSPKILGGLGRALRAQLRACAARLAGSAPELAARYRATSAQRALRGMRRNPRRLLTLVYRDVTVIEQALKLSVETAHPPSEAHLLDAATGFAAEVSKNLRCVLGVDCRRFTLPCLALAVESTDLALGLRRCERSPRSRRPAKAA